MMCQNCGKNTANTHFTQNINGTVTESWLCPECAEKLGISGMFSSGFANFGSLGGFGAFGGLSSLLGSMLGSSFGISSSGKLAAPEKCPQCGSTFNDIAQRGMVGCADCYTRFGDQLAPSIERLHGRAGHIGKGSGRPAPRQKAPGTPDAPAQTQSSANAEIAGLRAQLKAAVAKEEYEKAAQLRDRIKELEK